LISSLIPLFKKKRKKSWIPYQDMFFLSLKEEIIWFQAFFSLGGGEGWFGVVLCDEQGNSGQKN